MGLEDVLTQNAQIRDFLKHLVVIHGRALREQEWSPQLEKIRRDILVCLNDLCKLNEMLISCDGEIREEIELLKRSKEKFRKLAAQEQRIGDEREKWVTTKAVDDVSEDFSNEVVNVSSSYHPILDMYIDLVGAQNTSLAQEDAEGPAEEDDPKRLIASVKLLEKCYKYNTRDIQKLEQLVKTFTNDRHLIAKELKIQNAKIRRHTGHLDDELRKIKQSREKLLVKVGLVSAELQEASLTKTFFNFNLNRSRDQKLQTEVSDITDHAVEFIDIKILSLQDQLTHKKEDSSILTNQRNLWNDCMQCVKNLEDQLSFAFSNSKDLANSPHKVATWLKAAIDYLSDIVSSTDQDILVELVNSEKEVIEKAYKELPKNEKKKPLGPTGTFPSSSPPKHHSSPPFSVANKSPPKIGISEHMVNLSSSDNTYELGNITVMKNKSQKKED